MEKCPSRANFVPKDKEAAGGNYTPEGVPSRANFWVEKKEETVDDLLGESKPERKPRKPKE